MADHPARQLLGQLLRIVVSDKRTFVGTLEVGAGGRGCGGATADSLARAQCFDAAGNLILSNADEYFAWKGDTSLGALSAGPAGGATAHGVAWRADRSRARRIGTVLVGPDHIVSAEQLNGP